MAATSQASQPSRRVVSGESGVPSSRNAPSSRGSPPASAQSRSASVHVLAGRLLAGRLGGRLRGGRRLGDVLEVAWGGDHGHGDGFAAGGRHLCGGQSQGISSISASARRFSAVRGSGVAVRAALGSGERVEGGVQGGAVFGGEPAGDTPAAVQVVGDGEPLGLVALAPPRVPGRRRGSGPAGPAGERRAWPTAAAS